jgi:hypothetical protein
MRVKIAEQDLLDRVNLAGGGRICLLHQASYAPETKTHPV